MLFTNSFKVMAFIYYTVSAVLILLGIRKYREHKWGRCKNSVKLTRKIAVITGANSGIGYEIAKNLASREAQVIMACRNLKTAKNAMHKIKQELKKSAVIIPMELNLKSLQSIKYFAEQIKSIYSEIHILVNNAGVSYPKGVRHKTDDGFEIHFGIHHLGHFLLTNLLMDLLKNAEDSRILIISSLLHERGTLYLDDLNLERISVNVDAYASSKLANFYFYNELSKLLHNSNVQVFAICPGWAYTNLFRHYSFKWYVYILILPIAFYFMRSPKQAAQTAIFCATQPGIQNGCYSDCKRYKSELKIDEITSKRLWQISKEMIFQTNPQLGNEIPNLL